MRVDHVQDRNRKIYDSVHGFIRFNEIENALIDSYPFQRLHYLHQLGIAYLVYPGATHTRFEHSLGTMELATRIFDKIASKFAIPDEDYWRQVIRLAALSHDLGHLPFSHVAEKQVLGKEGHERFTIEIIRSAELLPIWQKLNRASAIEDVIKMAVGFRKLGVLEPSLHFSPIEKILSEVITADFFGADRIDYLLRDAFATGVSHGLFDYDQLIETLCILPDNQGLNLGIEENGIESCEALLLARHFMHRRVYQYPSVKAYAFHLLRCMENLNFSSLKEYLDLTDNEILVNVKKSRHSELHAAALFDRTLRFKAFALPKTVNEENFLQSIEQLKIPHEKIAWDFVKSGNKTLSLCFPVLVRGERVVDANSCSQVQIPLESASWVYVSPELEKPLHNQLEKSYNWFNESSNK